VQDPLLGLQAPVQPGAGIRGHDVERGGLDALPDRPVHGAVEDIGLVPVHPEHEAGVDHDAQVVQPSDHQGVVAADVLPLALHPQLGCAG
jgi:hypothetical protein